MSVTRNRLLFVLLPLLLAVGLSLMLPSSVSSRNGGGNVRIEANAEAVSVAESTVTLLGVTAHIDARTAFREDDKEGKEPFTLADIRAGDRLEIRASLDAQGRVVVHRRSVKCPKVR